MKKLISRLFVPIMVAASIAACQTVAAAQSFNYSHRYSTTASSMSNRAAMRAALRKARLRKAQQQKARQRKTNAEHKSTSRPAGKR
jgi:hypothetical protein